MVLVTPNSLSDQRSGQNRFVPHQPTHQDNNNTDVQSGEQSEEDQSEEQTASNALKELNEVLIKSSKWTVESKKSSTEHPLATYLRTGRELKAEGWLRSTLRFQNTSSGGSLNEKEKNLLVVLYSQLCGFSQTGKHAWSWTSLLGYSFGLSSVAVKNCFCASFRNQCSNLKKKVRKRFISVQQQQS